MTFASTKILDLTQADSRVGIQKELRQIIPCRISAGLPVEICGSLFLVLTQIFLCCTLHIRKNFLDFRDGEFSYNFSGWRQLQDATDIGDGNCLLCIAKAGYLNHITF